jgi:hypothetical protein
MRLREEAESFALRTMLPADLTRLRGKLDSVFEMLVQHAWGHNDARFEQEMRQLLHSALTVEMVKNSDMLELMARHQWGDPAVDAGFEREIRSMMRTVLEKELARADGQ